MTDADHLFDQALQLRKALTNAEKDQDLDRIRKLRAEINEIRSKAAVASANVEAAGEELLAMRHQLRKLAAGGRSAWLLRIFRGGSGSADRWHVDPMPQPNSAFRGEERQRIVRRIYELEERLISVDAMGDMPPLNPRNVERW